MLFNECQRLHLEAMGTEGIRKQRVERVRGAASTILIGQETSAKNPRSTVGTPTDANTDLRMMFEKLHARTGVPWRNSTRCSGKFC